MDDHYWRNRTWTKTTLKMTPSEYFRRNWKVTFIREPFAVATRHWIGVDNLMWSTDYPHHRHDWPYSRRIVEESMAVSPTTSASACAATTPGSSTDWARATAGGSLHRPQGPRGTPVTVSALTRLRPGPTGHGD